MQLRSAIKAVQDPLNNASQLSSLAAPTVFDKEKFLNDEAYRTDFMSKSEPGRVFQSDKTSTTHIKPLSNYYQEVVQGEEVEISVKAAPGLPVAVFSPNLGIFSNSLTHQTVISGSDGIATFIFSGIAGTISDSPILVSSLGSKGQLKFIVHTVLPTKQN